MRKRLTAVALAGTVGLGAVGATAVAYPALADNSKNGAPQAPSAEAQKAAQARRTAAIRDALKGLVDDKTLTADQADKVAGTLAGSDALRGGGPGGGGRLGLRPGGGLLGVEGPEADDAAAKVLGMTTDELRKALQSGSTLADLAKKQGKDVDTLVSALVSAARDRLDAGVKAGKITQAMADQIEKTLEQRVRDVVQNGRPALGGMGGRWHDKGSLPAPGSTDGPGGHASRIPKPSEVFPNGRPTPAPTASAANSVYGTA